MIIKGVTGNLMG